MLSICHGVSAQETTTRVLQQRRGPRCSRTLAKSKQGVLGPRLLLYIVVNKHSQMQRLLMQCPFNISNMQSASFIHSPILPPCLQPLNRVIVYCKRVATSFAPALGAEPSLHVRPTTAHSADAWRSDLQGASPQPSFMALQRTT